MLIVLKDIHIKSQARHLAERNIKWDKIVKTTLQENNKRTLTATTFARSRTTKFREARYGVSLLIHDIYKFQDTYGVLKGNTLMLRLRMKHNTFSVPKIFKRF